MRSSCLISCDFSSSTHSVLLRCRHRRRGGEWTRQKWDFLPASPARSTSGWSSAAAALARAAAGKRRAAGDDGRGRGRRRRGWERGEQRQQQQAGGRARAAPSVTKNHRYLDFLPKFCWTSSTAAPHFSIPLVVRGFLQLSRFNVLSRYF